MSYVSEGREYGTVKSFNQKRALIATDECGDTDPCSKYGRNTQRGPDSGASDGMRVHISCLVEVGAKTRTDGMT
jgi:hypothetical protein